MENDIVSEKLYKLYNATEDIGNSKSIEEKY
jgi:hypothetical protein